MFLNTSDLKQSILESIVENDVLFFSFDALFECDGS